MYGEYDTARYPNSSQDEDSGNIAHSYPSYRMGRPKRSTLGKGGCRELQIRDLNSVAPCGDLLEMTNEDSNSLTGPDNSSSMGWLRETPVKDEFPVGSNNMRSPPVAFKSNNTINKSSALHTDKSSISDYVGSIMPSGVPYSETKPDKYIKSLFGPDCKRSLSFKPNEPVPSVLRDVINIDNISKTPGSKVGLSNYHFEKNRVTTGSTSEKENFVSNLFDPSRVHPFNTDVSEPKISQHLYMRKPGDSAQSSVSLFKKTSPDIDFNPFTKKPIDNVDLHSKNDIKLPAMNPLSNEVDVVQSSNNFKLSSTNINEPLDLKIREHLIQQAQAPVTSLNFPSFTNPANNVSNSYSNCLKDSFNKIEGCASKDSLPFLPFSSNNDGNFLHTNPQTKHSFGYPFVQSEVHPTKSYDEVFSYAKPTYQESFNKHLVNAVSATSTMTDDNSKSDLFNTVLLKPACKTGSSIDEKTKPVENVIENKYENVNNNKLTTVSNADSESSHTESGEKNNKLIPSAVQSDHPKAPNSYASVVSMKPAAVTQSNLQQKSSMAPPPTAKSFKLPQGLIKTNRSTVSRTQTNTLQNSRFNCGFNSKEAPAHQKIHVNNRPYDVLSTLGKGGSSEVFLVLEPQTSKLMAVKCVNLSQVDKVIADGYLNEVELLLKLQGCHTVIRMFDHEYLEDQKILNVVMEKGDTDLSKFLRDITKTKNIPMTMIIYYWTEMLFAVKDIHDKGIIHSDLKPANFLLVCGRLKLIDFGIASSLQGDMTSVHKEVTTGTWNYMSPEAIKNNGSSVHGYKISYKSDVWSLGCILYNLVYGKTPFSHITNTWAKLMAIADVTHNIKFPDEMEGRGKVPAVILTTLKNCLTRDPKQRPSVSELLNYEYYQSSDISVTKLDSAVRKMKDEIALQVKRILPLEYWGKVVQEFGQSNVENIVNLERAQMAGRIKNVLPSEYWNQIAYIFGETQDIKTEPPFENSG